MARAFKSAGQMPFEFLFDALLGKVETNAHIKVSLTQPAADALEELCRYLGISRTEFCRYLFEDLLESFGILHPSDRSTLAMQSPFLWAPELDAISKTFRLSAKARSRLAKFAARQAVSAERTARPGYKDHHSRFVHISGAAGVLAGGGDGDTPVHEGEVHG